MKILSALVVAVGPLCVATAFADPCPPTAFAKPQLLELKQHEFSFDDAERVQTLALGLLACLGDPDPVLRLSG